MTNSANACTSGSTAQTVMLVVGVLATIVCSCLITYYGKKELNKILNNKQPAAMDEEEIELTLGKSDGVADPTDDDEEAQLFESTDSKM